MAFELIPTEVVRQMAKTFAEEFQKAGLFGGQSSSGSTTTSQTERTAANAAKKWRKNDTAAQKLHDDKMKREKQDIDATEDSTQVTESQTKGMLSFGSALSYAKDNLTPLFTFAALLRGGTQAVDDFSTQIKSGALETNNVLSQMATSFRLGVDPQVLTDLQTQNRAAVLAMGGVDAWRSQLIDSRDTMFKYTGGIEEALRFTTDSLQTMRLAGINPTIGALMDLESGDLKGFGKTMRDISVMSGKSMTEVNMMIREFVDSEEVRFRLAARRTSKERQDVLSELATRQKMLLALGYTAEQATRAGQTLDRLAGKGPRERMKEAAQARAAFGMVGMGGQGAEVQKLLVMGQRRGAEENARLAELMGQYQQRAAESTIGPLSAEMAIMTSYQKFGMDQYKEMLNVSSEAAKEQQKMAVEQKTAGEANATMVAILRETRAMGNRIFDHPFFALVAGLLGTIATSNVGMLALATTKSAIGGIGQALGKFGGKLGMITKGLGALGLGIGILGGAFKTLTQSTEATTKSAEGIGQQWFGEGIIASITNAIFSLFRNIGKAVTFGLVDNVNTWITDTFFSNKKSTPSENVGRYGRPRTTNITTPVGIQETVEDSNTGRLSRIGRGGRRNIEDDEKSMRLLEESNELARENIKQTKKQTEMIDRIQQLEADLATAATANSKLKAEGQRKGRYGG